jgi:hypothetical protein
VKGVVKGLVKCAATNSLFWLFKTEIFLRKKLSVLKVEKTSNNTWGKKISESGSVDVGGGTVPDRFGIEKEQWSLEYRVGDAGLMFYLKNGKVEKFKFTADHYIPGT